MPALKVWNADDVVASRRSMAGGYAGVPDPLRHRENTVMVLGDADDRVDGILAL